MSEEQKEKIRNTIKERWAEGAYANREGNFHSGHTPWNKGKTKETDASLMTVSEKLKGRVFSEETIKKMSIAKKGKKAHNCIPVQCVETGEVFESFADVLRKTGINNLSGVVDNPNRTAGKFHWVSIKEE